MKHFTIIITLFSLLTVLTFSSCDETMIYPVEPNIEYVSFTKVQNTDGIDEYGYLTISFTDGDGDLGLEDYDTLAPYNEDGEYYYNFIIKYYEKENGVYQEVILSIPNNSRIPVLAEDGTKNLRGEIEMELFINNPLSNNDTIMFETFIYDRALNKSNVIRTPDIVIIK